jgi:hypothetical protein
MADKTKQIPSAYDEPEGEQPAIPPAPSLVGMSLEQFQILIGSLGKTSSDAMIAAHKQMRKENPNYPDRSVFNPAGVYDDDGLALPAKVKLLRPTFFVGVRLAEDLLTPDEIELCNRIAANKYSRDGRWKAEFDGAGSQARLMIDVPCKTVDDRMGLPPLTHILRELADGADAVNPDTMQKRIDALEAQVKSLAGTRA